MGRCELDDLLKAGMVKPWRQKIEYVLIALGLFLLCYFCIKRLWYINKPVSWCLHCGTAALLLY